MRLNTSVGSSTFRLRGNDITNLKVELPAPVPTLGFLASQNLCEKPQHAPLILFSGEYVQILMTGSIDYP